MGDDELRAEIRKRRAEGQSYQQIADALGRSLSAVWYRATSTPRRTSLQRDRFLVKKGVIP
jgi:DNA-directed RNA polymerase specialized sigma24 family protein